MGGTDRKWPVRKDRFTSMKGVPSKVLGADAHRWSHNSGSRLSGRDIAVPTGTYRNSRPMQLLRDACVFGFTCHDSTQSLSGQCTRRGISPLFKTGDRSNRPLSLWASGFCKTEAARKNHLIISAFCICATCLYFSFQRNYLKTYSQC